MKKGIPILALLLCCMIWGTTFVAVKQVSSKIDPFLLSTLRNTIAVIILLPLILLTKNSKSLKDKLALKNGFVLGLILAAIYVVQTIGLQFTSSTHSAFITSSAVIMVPIMLVFTGKQKLSVQQIGSIFIVAFGLYFLTNSAENLTFNNGDLITFIGAIICAVQIILAGYFVRKTNFLGLIFYQFLFSGVLSFIGLITNSIILNKEIFFQESAIYGVIYLGILGTLFCFFVTVWAQKYVSTIFTAMIFALEPVFASTASYVYSGELFTKVELFGAVGVLLGLLIYNVPIKKVTSAT